MEHLQPLAIGAAIGVAASAGVGPVNLMSIQRALSRGFLSGLSVGAGAVVADVLFATAAAAGLSALGGFIHRHASWLQLAGGGLLIAFGVHSLIARPTMRQTCKMSSKGTSAATTAFAMKLTNPGTSLSFIALFGAFGDLVPEPGERVRVAQLVLGVAVGGLAWWAVLALAAGRLRARVTDRALQLISRTIGSLLIGLGSLILVRLAFLWLGLL